MYLKNKKVVKWEMEDILKVLGGGGLLAAIVSVIGNMMGWIRFGKKDSAEIGKIQSEIALNAATVAEKKIADEIKISETAIEWAKTFSSSLEQANIMIDKKQEENDRLHGIIDVMKKDFEREVRELTESFNKRIKELEGEFEKSKQEIKRLKDQLEYGNRRK